MKTLQKGGKDMADYQVKSFDMALAIMKQAGVEPIENQKSNHVELSETLADALIAQMTLKEKVHMLGGHWNVVNGLLHGRAYNYDPIAGGGCKRLGIPPILFSDGPRGVVMKNSTCFPTSNTRAAAFDTALEQDIGEAIAKECIAQGANYFAGVCINLLRHPSWGRAQESYGEDQYLTGRFGTALTRGVQKHGVIACPKHFYMNSIENLRFSVSADADEETVRDVYLPHFETCFDAGAGSVMSAYNKVNGTYCGESKEVFDHLKALGFKGFSISDFMWGVHDGAESLRAGLDIEMPFTFKRGRKLVNAVKRGDVPEMLLNEHCRNIIATLLRFQNLYRAEKFDGSVIASEAHTALARRALEEGAVLLKNNGCLPICDTNTKIALVGRFANEAVIGDHGSSSVHPPYVVTPYDGLKKVYPNLTLVGSNDPAACAKAAQSADRVIAVLGNDYVDEGEFVVKTRSGMIKGGDRKSLRLHDDEVRLIRALKETGTPLAVVLYSGSALLIDEWEADADAILYAGYPGMEGGNALANLISGKVNPSGKLPFTIAQKESDYPFFPYTDEKDQSVRYDYYHGYALFDKEGKTPAFPFGFGLSYTSFTYTDQAARDDGLNIVASCKVKNAGDTAGTETVLVFVGSEIEGKPKKLLKGFARVALEPGEVKMYEILIPKRDLRLYDKKAQEMTIPEHVSVYIGKNAADADGCCIQL